jgi:hypothetical protein
MVASPFLPRVSLAGDDRPSFARTTADLRRINADYFRAGEWLRLHHCPGELLAINAAGIVPYVSGMRTLDMLGLTDAHIGRRAVTLGHGAIGHEKHDATYVLDRAPDVVVLGLPVISRRRVRVADLAAWYGKWAPYLPGDVELLGSERFGAAYGLSSVRLPDGGWLTSFVRQGRSRDCAVQSALPPSPSAALASAP